MLGHVAEVWAPSQMQGPCRGSIPLLTGHFGLRTLELVKFLQKPARLEHRSLHRQNLVLSHCGTRWDNCKCPNSDVHRLKRQARRGSIGSAAQGEGCRMTGVALGMLLCALPAPELQRGRMGHEQEARLTLFCKSCLRMYLDAAAQTLQISGRQRQGTPCSGSATPNRPAAPYPRRRQWRALQPRLALSKDSQRRGCPAAFLSAPSLQEARPGPRKGRHPSCFGEGDPSL